MTGHGPWCLSNWFCEHGQRVEEVRSKEISYLCVTVVGGILMDWVLLIVNTTLVNLFG